MPLILSIFTGGALFDRGFEREGFCCVSAGDLFWGRDVREFRPARHKFDGIIGGPPCQDFSRARRTPPTGYGLEMLSQFIRIVTESEPEWWMCENVPGVPDVMVPGYRVQRFNLNVTELGHNQNRSRRIQFGSRDGVPLVIPRNYCLDASQPCVVASEGRHGGAGRTLAEMCVLQGLPADTDFPGLSLVMKKTLVGNGVHVGMAAALARAVRDRHVTKWTRACACGCGAPVRRGVTLATQACRKRMSRAAQNVTASGPVTMEMAL